MKIIKKSMYLFLTLMIMISCIPSVQAKASLDDFEKSEIVEKKSDGKDNVESQDLDSLVSIFELSFKDDVTEYLSYSQIYAYLRFATSDSSGSLSDYEIVIKAPKEYTSSFHMAQGGTIAGTPEYSEDEDFNIVTAKLNIIASGNDVTIPFDFFSNMRIIPDNEVIPVFAEMRDAEGNVVTSTKIDYINKIYELKSVVGGSYIQGLTNIPFEFVNEWEVPLEVEAGKKSETNEGYLSDAIEDLKPVLFGASLMLEKPSDYDSEQGLRTYNKQKFEFVIPESAVFIQEKNPHWEFNDKTRIASRTIEGEELDSLPFGDLVTPETEDRLALYFPNVELESEHTIYMKHTLYPINIGVNEEIVTYEDNLTIVIEETRKFLEPKPEPERQWVLGLRTEGVQGYYDGIGYKNDFINDTKFNVTATNVSRYDKELENLKLNITEVPEALSFDHIIVNPAGEDAFVGTINMYATDRNGERVDLLIDAKIDEEIIIDVGPDLRTFHVETTPGSFIKTKKGITITYDLDITDFDKTTDEPIYNTIYVDGVGSYTESLPVINKDFMTFFHRPANPRMKTNFSKYSNPKPDIVYYVGDEATVSFFVSVSGVEAGTVIDMQNALAFLPEGVEYIEGSAKVDTFSGDSHLEGDRSKFTVEPKIEYNYKNSGQTVLVWNIPELTKKSNTDFTSISVYTFKVKFNNFADQGDNVIRSVAVWGNNDTLPPEDEFSIEDIYDLNENGSKSDHLTSHHVTLIHQPTKEIKVKKYVKGSLDHDFMRAPNIAMGEIQSKIDYRVDIKNYSQVIYNNFELIDVLPHVGDKTTSKDANGEQVLRHSDHTVQLTGKIDVPDGFTVYYSNEVPNYDNDDYAHSVQWLSEVEDYADVRSIRIVMNEGTKLNPLDTLVFDFQGEIASEQEVKNGDHVVNTFGYSTGTKFNSGESNTATFEFVEYKVQGNVFNDFNEDSLFKDEEGFSNHLVTLVDKDSNPILDREGNAIFDYTDENGFYEMVVNHQGMYRVLVEHPEDYDLSNPKMDDENGSHIIEGTNHSDVFELEPSNRIVYRNAGYYSEDASLILSNTVVNAEDEVMESDILFEYLILIDETPYNGLVVVDGVEMIVDDGLVYLKGGSKVSIQDLDKGISYKIVQTPVEHYKTTPEECVIEGNLTEPIVELEFKNMYLSPVSNITVRKIWIGGPDIKPSIDIQLLRDGRPYGEIVTLENGTVEYTWENLPENDLNGNPFNYSVEEIDVHEDYESSVDGFEITNRFIERIPAIPLEPSKPKVPLTPLEPSKPLTPNIPLVPLQPSQDTEGNGDELPPTGLSTSHSGLGMGLVSMGLIFLLSRKRKTFKSLD